ncbi:unnamed protein product [Cuscuta europaea]|uniref:HAT C-terminal dimerisation domain-containing protein n=1 Tax=Cuscuta europaea TaxID=41803 RepID=A0A9P1E2C9_CUSEU|nr:unnamed protein product [Cuscuta europaea]
MSLPSENEWSLCKEICSRLKLFYNATRLFSRTLYPTANMFFPTVCEIKLALNQWTVCGIPTVQLMASNMILKFDKYWSDVNGIMGVAAILDPRYNLLMLEYYFGKIYSITSEFEVEKIVDFCRELVKQYEEQEKTHKNDQLGCQTESNAGESSSLSDFDLYASQRKRISTRSELDQYLEDDILLRSTDFDVLSWWKSNKGKYPILSQIARDILVIPLSTVASESSFSTSGQLIGPHRSRLKEETIEALMCAQSWILADLNEKGGGSLSSVFYDSDGDNDEGQG